MKISKQARRDAKQLFHACKPNGVMDDAKIRQTFSLVIERKPRGYVGIINHLHRLVKLDVARRDAVVQSAAPLSADLQSRLGATLAARHGAGLTLRFETNPSLIGGLRIKVGSDVYDGSVAGRLAALDEAL